MPKRNKISVSDIKNSKYFIPNEEINKFTKSELNLSWFDLETKLYTLTDEINIESIADPDTSILEEDFISEVKEVIEEEEEEEEEETEEQVYFGYNIFENNPYLNKEYLLGNIDEGYLIAPGDELRIMTYGDNSFEQNVTVDRNGNINIIGYGLFFASGNSFTTIDID